MSKHFYFIDPNGRFESEDGSVRYSFLKGKKAFDKLKERKTRFMRYQDGEDEILIELCPEYSQNYRKYENREQYLLELATESKVAVLSLDNVIEIDGEEVVYHDVVASDYDLEAEVLKREELLLLKKSLNALSKEERQLISAIYLVDEPISAREYAKLKGVSHTVINRRVERIFKKMRIFFEKVFPN